MHQLYRAAGLNPQIPFLRAVKGKITTLLDITYMFLEIIGSDYYLHRVKRWFEALKTISLKPASVQHCSLVLMNVLQPVN